jgi:hypothetical protein
MNENNGLLVARSAHLESMACSEPEIDTVLPFSPFHRSTKVLYVSEALILKALHA